jgi:hypothetical protein
MSRCPSVEWDAIGQSKIRCDIEEGHASLHSGGALRWETKAPCPGCGDGTGVRIDVENYAADCPVCAPTYEDLKADVQRLKGELSLQKTLAAAAGVSALLGHNCPPTTMAAEWEEAARMFRASWEKEKEVSATSGKLGYAAAIVDVVGKLRAERPCNPTDTEKGRCLACVGMGDGCCDCSNVVHDEAAEMIAAMAPGSLALVEEALYDRCDAIVALRNIAAILDGDGGHRQDGDASFAATVERIHLLVCDMREALRYAERAPLIIAEMATDLDDAMGRMNTGDLDEIRDYAGQLAKMLAVVAPKLAVVAPKPEDAP